MSRIHFSRIKIKKSQESKKSVFPLCTAIFTIQIGTGKQNLEIRWTGLQWRRETAQKTLLSSSYLLGKFITSHISATCRRRNLQRVCSGVKIRMNFGSPYSVYSDGTSYFVRYHHFIIFIIQHSYLRYTRTCAFLALVRFQLFPITRKCLWKVYNATFRYSRIAPSKKLRNRVCWSVI